jgi:ankyrin repeat protein
MVEILLEAKANLDLKDCVGYTAYTLAVATNHEKIIALLNAESIKTAGVVINYGLLSLSLVFTTDIFHSSNCLYTHHRSRRRK